MSSLGVLFDDLTTAVPSTEGIKYAGSKLKILPEILRLIRKTGATRVLDGFSGSTRVAQALAAAGFHTTANDRAAWSKVLGTCYLKSKKEAAEYRDLICHLNSLPPKDGWFTQHYGGHAENLDSKRPWQIHNTMKLDAIREEIDRLNLNEVDKSVALTSLILALDQVDSTLGHFASYLKAWSPRSYKTLFLKVPLLDKQEMDHVVLQEDIFDVAGKVGSEVAYFDPPYGSNNEKMPPSRVRYSAYYHLWTTICLNDRPPLFGRANRRTDTSDTIAPSIFEEFRKTEDGRFIAVDAIARLLRNARAEWIVLSYSTGGRATLAELHEAIKQSGKLVEVVQIDHKKHVMATMKWTNEWLRDAEEPNKEMLFLIRK